jgi:hypothetical protein
MRLASTVNPVDITVEIRNGYAKTQLHLCDQCGGVVGLPDWADDWNVVGQPSVGACVCNDVEIVPEEEILPIGTRVKVDVLRGGRWVESSTDSYGVLMRKIGTVIENDRDYMVRCDDGDLQSIPLSGDGLIGYIVEIL